MKRICLLLIIATLITACSKTDKNIDNNGDEDNKEIPRLDEEHLVEEEELDDIKKMIDNMTLDEKIGQLLIIGLDGPKVDEHIERMVKDYKIGGFILFKHNIVDEEQALSLLNSLKSLNSQNPIPLFLSIDEEGGRVSRLPNSFTKLPPAEKVGRRGDKAISLEYGTIIGKRVKALGFNVNFAPVLDINSNPNNPVIGDRAFGSDKSKVITHGLRVMEGIKEEGILAVVKHFPGHGDTHIDSHIELPIIEKELDELKELELTPFKEAIKKGVDGIMVAHILFPKLDSEYPSTLSNKIIEGLLRNELGFEGLIFSDDMTMGAIVENFSIEEAAVKFLKAGGDVLLICHGYENHLKVIERIKEEILEGRLTEEEIDEKTYRIIKTKKKYGFEDNIIDKIDLELLNSKSKKLLDRIDKKVNP